ncbi:ANTAR domain-containing protein [Cellulosimicrobium terreum]|nr:ANTAR domain-containing protein [Cellulosimicrobium terreum]
MDRAGVQSQLATRLAGTGRREPLALRLCRACVEMLGARGGAITLSQSAPERWTVCATDPVAERLEDLEDVVGEGPGQEVARTRSAAVVRLAADASGGLGEFVHHAREVAGTATLYALPLLPAPYTVGVVTLHQADGVELALPPEERQFLADAVGASLLRDDPELEGSASAWRPRATVHQATGMVVAQLGLAPVDALALLRAHAFADATTLTELATSVVERRYDFSAGDDSPGRAGPRRSGS